MGFWVLLLGKTFVFVIMLVHWDYYCNLMWIFVNYISVKDIYIYIIRYQGFVWVGLGSHKTGTRWTALRGKVGWSEGNTIAGRGESSIIQLCPHTIGIPVYMAITSRRSFKRKFKLRKRKKEKRSYPIIVIVIRSWLEWQFVWFLALLILEK